jgi:7,8-dihydropterin-6-yl-methyl-4-(beta-D-ribofuranosyl)aminobenzene 5'-phosphate synthase
MRTITSMMLVWLSMVSADNISITILYNNVPYKENLTTAWGMSCLIQGTEKTILFDTGGDGTILLTNMKELNVDPMQIDIVFLSHIHGDHVEGVWRFLETNPDVVVYLPRSFPQGFKQRIEEYGAQCTSVGESAEICDAVYSTGELGVSLKEQSLIIETKKGLIVVTGCAHPGIVHIVQRARALRKQNVYLVMGGFHLMAYTDKQVNNIIEELQRIEVEKVGPSHCTGGEAIELFRKAWNEDFFDLGCGARFELEIQ